MIVAWNVCAIIKIWCFRLSNRTKIPFDYFCLPVPFCPTLVPAVCYSIFHLCSEPLIESCGLIFVIVAVAVMLALRKLHRLTHFIFCQFSAFRAGFSFLFTYTAIQECIVYLVAQYLCFSLQLCAVFVSCSSKVINEIIVSQAHNTTILK